MIERVVIRHWQSLRHVDLPLGRFTVIVGASSSGKTALMRALRALTCNTRGTSQITRGASAASITAHTGDAFVSLEHARGSWFYRVSVAGHEQDYTKLGGAVPEQVTAVLGVAPAASTAESLHFAGQFDRPFLLGETGSRVARVLGELTNVDLVLDAVREANRVRTQATGTLRTREADLARVEESLREFAHLPAAHAALDQAEAAQGDAVALLARVEALTSLLTRTERAEAVLTRHAVVVPLPASDALDVAYEARAGFVGVLQRTGRAETAQAQARRRLAQLDDQVTELERALHDALVNAGVCPTCGQRVTSNH